MNLSAGAAILEDPRPAAGAGAGASSTRAGFLPDSSHCSLTYIRYSSCRYNERQLIHVTVVRRVRPRAERWCDCKGHRRWKRAGRTLFRN